MGKILFRGLAFCVLISLRFNVGLPGDSNSKNLPAVQETQVQSLGQEDPLKRERLPTPVFSPGEFHGQRSLAGYSPWGRKESDTTE